jgi:hypothetical protein
MRGPEHLPVRPVAPPPPAPRRRVLRLPVLAGGIGGAVLGLLVGIAFAEAPPWAAAGPGARIRPGTSTPCPAVAAPAAPEHSPHRDPRCAERPGVGDHQTAGRRR